MSSTIVLKELCKCRQLIGKLSPWIKINSFIQYIFIIIYSNWAFYRIPNFPSLLSLQTRADSPQSYLSPLPSVSGSPWYWEGTLHVRRFKNSRRVDTWSQGTGCIYFNSDNEVINSSRELKQSGQWEKKALNHRAIFGFCRNSSVDSSIWRSQWSGK